MLTKEQQREVEGRERHRLRVFSGDVYAPQPDGSVIAINPDGVIRRENGMPSRGVSLDETDASDNAIAAVLGPKG